MIYTTSCAECGDIRSFARRRAAERHAAQCASCRAALAREGALALSPPSRVSHYEPDPLAHLRSPGTWDEGADEPGWEDGDE